MLDQKIPVHQRYRRRRLYAVPAPCEWWEMQRLSFKAVILTNRIPGILRGRGLPRTLFDNDFPGQDAWAEVLTQNYLFRPGIHVVTITPT